MCTAPMGVISPLQNQGYWWTVCVNVPVTCFLQTLGHVFIMFLAEFMVWDVQMKCLHGYVAAGQ